MKHVGVNVAADMLMTLAYVGVRGGLVLVSADDPSMFSSQNEQDNRYYARLSGPPLLEPSSPQEAKEMVAYGFHLSEALRLPVLLRTTTWINHTRGVVTLGSLPQPCRLGHFHKDPSSQVMVPAGARRGHATLLQHQAQAAQEAEKCRFNEILGSGPWGLVASGVSVNYVRDAVADLGLENQVTILKLAFTQPLPIELVSTFLTQVKKVLVVEELEPFLEEALRALAQSLGLTLPIRGKGPEFFSRLYEYHPRLVRQVMARYFGVDYQPPELIDPARVLGALLPEQPPILCPGCPPSGQVLHGQDGLAGFGARGGIPERYRLLHFRPDAAFIHGRFYDLHGVQHRDGGWHLSGYGSAGGRFYRRFHFFPCRHTRANQRGS